MELSAKVNKRDFIIHYINIWNGTLKLTDKEKDILYELLYRYINLMQQGLFEPYIGPLVFSKQSLSDIKKKLGISSQGMNNYKNQLIDKRIIKEEAGTYYIEPRLIPQEEITFKFIVNYGE